MDIAFGRIYRANPTGEVELLIEYDGEPNGLKIHRDGRIFVALGASNQKSEPKARLANKAGKFH